MLPIQLSQLIYTHNKHLRIESRGLILILRLHMSKLVPITFHLFFFGSPSTIFELLFL